MVKHLVNRCDYRPVFAGPLDSAVIGARVAQMETRLSPEDRLRNAEGVSASMLKKSNTQSSMAANIK